MKTPGPIRSILNLMYPRRCMGCGVRLEDSGKGVLCGVCLSQSERAGADACPRCAGQRGPHATGKAACASCGGESLPFTWAACVYRYSDPIRKTIHGLKFQGDLSPVDWIAQELIDTLGGVKWVSELDLVVPVPLHWTRRLARRFNQSELLARPVARANGLPLVVHALRRIRRTVPQSTLEPDQRRENVRGAFRAVRPSRIRGKVILLVDDVMSTCSTVSECARTLKRAGARRVHVLTFAR
jgi:ComF family protein